MTLILICVVAWLLILLFALALCGAAAAGDREMDRWR